jgi:predicted anti-sigma-YlaC factor YlaD
MNAFNCETIRQAAMALADGETAPLSAEQVQAHLAGCAECRRAVEEMQSLARVLDAQSHQPQAADLWPGIQGRIAVCAADSRSLNPAGMLAVLALVLLLVRGIVLTTAEPLEWAVRFIALLFVGGWFVLLRENPFAIHPQLVEGKKTRP